MTRQNATNSSVGKRSHDRGRLGFGLVLSVTLMASSLILLTAVQHAAPTDTGRPVAQSNHELQIYNDTDYPGTFSFYVSGDYTDTLTTIGDIDPGNYHSVTVPAGIDSWYVFDMAIHTSEISGTMNSGLTEAGLATLPTAGTFRFVQDDMGSRVLPDELLPTPVNSATPWDLTAEPTSTDEPTETPSATQTPCPGMGC